jgi:hypothetical protein
MRRLAPAILTAGGFAAGAVLLFCCYLRLSGTKPVTADGASQALQAWDILHGNWLLHGWALTDVSFYTTELPQYIGIEAARGLSPAVVHIAGAMTYTLLVLAAGLLARGRVTGFEGMARFAVAAGIMLAPQQGPGVGMLVLAPDHIGTQVPLLLIFLLIDRAPRRWYVPVTCGLALAWVEVGDRLAWLTGAVPIAAVCAVRAYRAVVRDREPLAARWLELALAGAASASIPVALAAMHVIGWLGGYTSDPLRTGLASPASLPAHLSITAKGILAFYGADTYGQPAGLAALLVLIHLAGLCLACWALCRVFRRFLGCQDLIAQVLATAIVLNLAAYLPSVVATGLYSTREIIAVLPFGAVLAGRVLTGTLIRHRLVPVAGGVLAAYGVALLAGIAQPQRPAVGQDLAGWLRGHQLTAGLTSYALANPVTLDSGGGIQLREPDWSPRRAGPGTYAASLGWFDPRRHRATFVVSTRQDGRGFYIPYAQAAAAFGRPARTYHYRGYIIWAWPANLLSDLHPAGRRRAPARRVARSPAGGLRVFRAPAHLVQHPERRRDRG